MAYEVTLVLDRHTLPLLLWAWGLTQMEIIFKGESPGERVFQGTCGNCKSIVQARPRELKTGGRYNELDYYADCPVCNKSMSFEQVKHESSRIGVPICERPVPGVMGQ